MTQCVLQLSIEHRILENDEVFITNEQTLLNVARMFGCTAK